MKTKIIPILIFLLIGLFPNLMFAQNAVIWVETDTTQGHLGEISEGSVYISNAQNVIGVNVKLLFDNTVFECTSLIVYKISDDCKYYVNKYDNSQGSIEILGLNENEQVIDVSEFLLMEFKLQFKKEASENDNTQIVIDSAFASLADANVQPVSVQYINSRIYVESVTGIEDKLNDDQIPGKYKLFQNYPNPFNPRTKIKFSLPAQRKVKLTIFNILGQKIKTVVDKELQPGTHKFDWDSRNSSGILVSSGIYIYRIETEDFVKSRKLVLIR